MHRFTIPHHGENYYFEVDDSGTRCSDDEGNNLFFLLNFRADEDAAQRLAAVFDAGRARGEKAGEAVGAFRVQNKIREALGLTRCDIEDIAYKAAGDRG